MLCARFPLPICTTADGWRGTAVIAGEVLAGKIETGYSLLIDMLAIDRMV